MIRISANALLSPDIYVHKMFNAKSGFIAYRMEMVFSETSTQVV